MIALFTIYTKKQKNKSMKPKCLQAHPLFLQLQTDSFNLQFITQEDRNRLALMSQADKAFKGHQKISKLLNYKVNKYSIKDISEVNHIQDQDALKLMNMVIGGYVDDQFATYLSYNDFLQKKAQFGVLKSVYQSIQKKYRNKKIDQARLKFRSMLLMVFLQENIPKLSRVRVEELFSKNMIVW